MDTQTQIERLIELAIVQRTELKELVAQLPQLREHLSTEIEKAFDEAEPQLRAELEEWTTKQAADKTTALGVTLEAKIADLAKSLEISTQARYNAIIAEREENARLAAQAEAKIAEHAASLPSAVKDIVTAELARFPRAGEIDQLRKEFAEPRGLNPRGKWQAGETYNKLDLVTINGDSYTSNTDGNRTRPSRSSADWTLVAARGTGGGGGPTSLSELTTVPSDGDVLIGSGTSWVTSNLTAGAGISITVGPGAITISATDGDITLDDGTAASPSLHFTNDPDTGLYRPAANTLGISTSGVQRMYVDENGITTVGAGGTFDGSVHAANGNANNPSFSFTSDQDTGFFRHAANEIGIALGGTQYATLTSTTFSITPVVTMASSLRVNGTTDSSSKDTGAIVTEGGLGVEKSATFGGNLTASGTGSHVFGTTNTVTLAAGTVTATGIGKIAGIQVTGASTAATGVGVEVLWDNTSAIIQGFNRTGSVFTPILVGGSTVGLQIGGVTKFGLDASGNATLSGNLTVSNLITSAASSALVLRGDNATGGILTLNLSGTSTADFTQGNGRVVTTNTNSPEFRASRSSVIAALGVDATGGYVGTLTAATSLSLYANGTVAATLSATNGNFLIGTTTDGGQKLQVSGSALIYAASNTHLKLDNASDQRYTSIYFNNGGVQKAGLYWDNATGTVFLDSQAGSSSIKLHTSNTLALTLDSSQNATFAGRGTFNSLLTAKNAAGSVAFDVQPAAGGSAFRITPQSGATGAQFEAYSTVSGFVPLNMYASAYTFNTGNATFAGTVRSNTQEGFKIAAASGYFAGYEADGTTLNGYLQFINSIGTLLNQSIAGKNIALAIAGTPQLTLTTGDATFAGTVTAGTWASGNADKLKVSTSANAYAAYIANTAASGSAYGIRLHTDATAATDLLLVATSGSGGGSTRFIVKANGTLNAPSLPTSSVGLSVGDIWNDGGTLKIVQP